MTRILFRAPADPFAVHSVETTIERNLIATNAGNLVFLDAAWKLLSAPGVEITAGPPGGRPGDADRINERYDVYVIALANAFRNSYEPALARMTQLLRRLRIPVVVLGVGAQGTVDYDFVAIKPIERTVRAFMGAVLDRSPSIGVRGEGTLHYLNGLGFRDVDVIGCPSMFMWGDALRVERKVPALDERSRVVITISPYRTAMGPIGLDALARYPRLDVRRAGPRDAPPARGRDAARTAARPTPRCRCTPQHPFFREGRARVYIEPWSWIDDLRQADFVFGTRIHGGHRGAAGRHPRDGARPRLAHPRARPPLRDPAPPAARHAGRRRPGRLYEEADLGALHAVHGERFATFTGFLGRMGLDHAFAHDGAAAAFDRRIAVTSFAGAVVGPTPGATRRTGRRRRSGSGRGPDGSRSDRVRAGCARACACCSADPRASAGQAGVAAACRALRDALRKPSTVSQPAITATEIAMIVLIGSDGVADAQAVERVDGRRVPELVGLDQPDRRDRGGRREQRVDDGERPRPAAPQVQGAREHELEADDDQEPGQPERPQRGIEHGIRLAVDDDRRERLLPDDEHGREHEAGDGQRDLDEADAPRDRQRRQVVGRPLGAAPISLPSVRSTIAKTTVNQNTSWIVTVNATETPAHTTSPMLASPVSDFAAITAIAEIGTMTGRIVSSSRFQTRKYAGPMRNSERSV